LRVLTRSGQGLLGQSEELNGLMKKVLQQELQERICTQIIDDLYIGGQTQEETASNYIRVRSKLAKQTSRLQP
jgi:hypothetical protein